jgi:hypothetical protein
VGEDIVKTLMQRKEVMEVFASTYFLVASIVKDSFWSIEIYTISGEKVAQRDVGWRPREVMEYKDSDKYTCNIEITDNYKDSTVVKYFKSGSIWEKFHEGVHIKNSKGNWFVAIKYLFGETCIECKEEDSERYESCNSDVKAEKVTLTRDGDKVEHVCGHGDSLYTEPLFVDNHVIKFGYEYCKVGEDEITKLNIYRICDSGTYGNEKLIPMDKIR